MFLFGWILNFKLENLKTCFLEEYISKIKKTSRKVSHMSSTTQICLSFRFLCLHFWIHLAEIAMSFVSLPLCFPDVTLLWQVSQRFLSLHPSLSASLLVSVCLPLSLVSLHFDITVVTLCRSASPSLSFCPFLCLYFSLPLAWCFSDVTEVVWTSVSLSIGCRSLSRWVFLPSEWRWKWKSCTSRHSRGWTSCTCEHKTSGDAVTSCLFFPSPLFFSAEISQILKKFEKLAPDRKLQGSLKKTLGNMCDFFFFFLQMGHFAGNYQNISDNLFHTSVALAGGFHPNCSGNQTIYAFSGCLSWKNNINNPIRNSIYQVMEALRLCGGESKDVYIMACKCMYGSVCSCSMSTLNKISALIDL